MKNTAADAERREHRRFTYKPECRPVLQCPRKSYRVVNISVEGLKLELLSSPHQPFFADAELVGTLYLANDRQLSIAGDLSWIIGNEMGIKLKKAIPRKILRAEADFFLEPFPD